MGELVAALTAGVKHRKGRPERRPDQV